MSLLLDIRGRTTHAGTPLVHPTSENVVLANVFGCVKNFSPDAALNPWISGVTGGQINAASAWDASFWERQPRPVGVNEGSTEVDLVLSSEQSLLFVEVKMEADASSGVTHDTERDQLTRNLDVGFQRAQIEDQCFAVIYITPDLEEPPIVSQIRSGVTSFPCNPDVESNEIAQCLHWAPWASMGKVLAGSLQQQRFSEVESLFCLDLLSYLAGKGLWENTLPDEERFYTNKTYRPLQRDGSRFVPFANRSRKLDQSWRSGSWSGAEQEFRDLLHKLPPKHKALLKLLADNGGSAQQGYIMDSLPFLRGKTPGSLRSIKGYINAQAKACAKAPILAVGSGGGLARVHTINSDLKEMRDVVIAVAQAFDIREQDIRE